MIKSSWNKIVISLLFIFIAMPCYADIVLHQSYRLFSSGQGASSTFYNPIGCGTRHNNDYATESDSNFTWRTAGTFSNLYVNVLANDRAASTFRTRKGTSNANLVVSITGSTTGKFEDTSNSDVVTAGDNWHYSMTTGAGGTTFTYTPMQVLFAATTNTVSRVGCDANGNTMTASSTHVGPLAGDGTLSATDADSVRHITYRTAGTLNNLFLRIRTNGRSTTSTVRSRIGGANGNMSASVAGSATGNFEDTTNSDTVSVGTLVGWAYVTGTGTGNVETMGCFADFTTTNGQAMYSAAAGGGQTVLANVTTYYGFSGGLRTSTTESNTIGEANLPFTASLMQCNISANTVTAASTLTLRINSGAGAAETVSITASTTGIFQDTTNSDSILASDTLNYKIVTGATGTSLIIRSISVAARPQTKLIMVN